MKRRLSAAIVFGVVSAGIAQAQTVPTTPVPTPPAATAPAVTFPTPQAVAPAIAPAIAPTSTATVPATAHPVVASPANSGNATGPVPGANSFTESEAKHRFEANGFSDVTELKKDDQSIWRGKAMKSGKAVTVALDFTGNMFAQ